LYRVGLSEVCLHNRTRDATLDIIISMFDTLYVLVILIPLIIDYIHIWLTLAISFYVD